MYAKGQRIGDLTLLRVREETGLILAMTALWIAFPLLPPGGVAAVAVAVVVLTAVAFRKQWRNGAALGVFCTACLAGIACGIRLSQIWLALGITACIAAALLVPWMRSENGWLRSGTFGPEVQLLCLASAAIAATALLLWFTLLGPNVADIVEQFFPQVAPIRILIGGVLFAAVNAAVEEGAYRGVVMHALEVHVARPAALCLQAAAFGTLHVHGFPRGAIGVALAFVYGLMMGGIRLRAGGMLAPWLAHFCVDVAIVAMLVGLAL